MAGRRPQALLVRALALAATALALAGPAAAAFRADPALTREAQALARIYEGRLGVALTARIVAGRDPADTSGDLAATAAVDTSGTRVGGPGAPVCRVAMLPASNPDPAPEQRLTLAHEVFHCFQFQLADGMDALPRGWVREGTAEWAGSLVTGRRSDEYVNYLRTPELGLFGREYDAVGFWGALDQFLAGGLWTRLPAILAQRGDLRAYGTALGGIEEAFPRFWASYQLRVPRFGPAWQQLDPTDVDAAQSAPVTEAATSRAFTVPRLTTRIFSLAGSDDLLHVQIPKDALLGDGRIDTPALEDAWFCLGGRCECPPGTHATSRFPTAPSPVQGRVVLAVAGGRAGTTGSFRMHATREFCERDDAPTDPGGGRTFTDPHVVTFDHLAYDLLAAGELVATRSSAGGFEVQVRQEASDDLGLATSNTAVAILAGGSRVGVYGLPGRRFQVRVDGRAVSLDEIDRLELDGAVLRRELRLLTVSWPDGSQVVVDTTDSRALRIDVDPGPARRGTLSGFLGDADGDPQNDLTTPEGRTVDPRATGDRSVVWPRFRDPDAAFDFVHGPFADAWRVRGADSLFDYAPGQSTRTFVDRSIPRRRVTLADFAAATRARARRACDAAGLAGWYRQACLLDVASTGRTGLAAQVRRAARAGEWLLLDGFELLNGMVAAATAPGGTTVLAARGAVLGASTSLLATAVSPDGSVDPAEVVAHGVAGEVALGAGGDGFVAATPLLDLSAGIFGLASWRAPLAGTPWTGPTWLLTTPGALSALPAVAALVGGASLAATTVALPSLELLAGGAGGVPEPEPDGCAALAPGLAPDAAGGAWLAWSRVGTCAGAGVWAIHVAGTGHALAAAGRAPGSVATVLLPANAAVPTPVAADAAGAWLAYPAEGRVLAWRVGAPAPVEVAATPGAQAPLVLLATEPATGRLWVGWRDPAKRPAAPAPTRA
ncbi:MAG: VWD domain-containing protein [Thermoleophilia bacterium]